MASKHQRVDEHHHRPQAKGLDGRPVDDSVRMPHVFKTTAEPPWKTRARRRAEAKVARRSRQKNRKG